MEIEAPKITDWIQAIALLVGLPSLIYTTILLFKKDKNKEAKLKFLGSQVAIMQKQLYLNQTIARADRQPIFSVDFSVVLEQGFTIRLRNIGQLAIVSSVVLKNKESFRLETTDFAGKRIEFQELVTIMATYNEYYKEHGRDDIHFPILERIELSFSFKDSLGNEYRQYLTRPADGGNQFIISEPEQTLKI